MADALLDQARADAPRSTGVRGREIRKPVTSGPLESRTCLLQSSVGLVEDLDRVGVRPGRGPEGYCADFQICLPYRGLFVWEVGGEEIVGDPNQVVFVRGGESYRMHAPSPFGYAELIITPDLGLLSEVTRNNGWRLENHPLFARRSCRAHPHLQRFRTRFQHWAAIHCGERHGLEEEELLLTLVRCALQQEARQDILLASRTTRLIRRTKEFLEARSSCRIRLTDIARAVGASPAYLTDLFTRVEGVSLHQYLTQLRLARALVELRHAEDLTALALDLGFSSHSHFTFTFRRAFGCTPSQFREMSSGVTRPSVHEEQGMTAAARR